ncbi:MAG: GrpB family protein [Pseudomonadota bacterium]
MVEFVVPHDPGWKTAFAAEAALIGAALGGEIVRLHHIGSTAIPNILAKPIIDLLGVVADLDSLDMNSAAMEGLGYEVMGAFGIEGRRYFRKIDAAGRRTHHLHVFTEGSPHIERHLAFRDYLTEHPAVAAAYSDLKANLTSQGTPSWDSYIEGKDPFITVTEADALNWYRRKQPD